MQRPRPGLNENKLLMLYGIKSLDGITNQQAIRFFIENSFMDYIDMQLGLAELLGSGLLTYEEEPAGRVFNLTKIGHDALTHFAREVPHSRLSRVDELAQEYKRVFRDERHIFGDYFPAPGGGTMVRLSIREHGTLMFEITFAVGDVATAKRVLARWNEDARGMYSDIMERIQGNEK